MFSCCDMRFENLPMQHERWSQSAAQSDRPTAVTGKDTFMAPENTRIKIRSTDAAAWKAEFKTKRSKCQTSRRTPSVTTIEVRDAADVGKSGFRHSRKRQACLSSKMYAPRIDRANRPGLPKGSI